MGKEQSIFIITLFLLILNTLIVMSGFGTEGKEITAPALPEKPTLLNYISVIGDAVVFFFSVGFYTIIGLPLIVSALLIALNLMGITIAVLIIRGN